MAPKGAFMRSKMFGFFRSKKDKSFQKPSKGSGWKSLFVHEPFAGAWQKGESLKKETSLSHYAVFSCVSLISQDIAKLPFIYTYKKDGVEQHGEHKCLQALRKPNGYQNHIQFKESWLISKLLNGNSYILKNRKGREVVGYYVLDPNKVTPLVTDGGDVYYELKTDNLAGIQEETIIVPASEIIHDRWNCFFHPLVGLSPVFAASKSIEQGLKIQTNSSTFFGNKAVPSGILTAPGQISDDSAKRMKDHWEKNYSGDGAGKVAVLGDGLKFEAMAMTALDSQLIEQLQMTAEIICSVFKVPPYIAGVSDKRIQNSVEEVYLEYYQKALQHHIESMEASLDDGIGFDGVKQSIDLDTKKLMRMDTLNRYKSHTEALRGAWKTINEVRAEEGFLKVTGGDTPYLQQQNYSLEALSKRDAKDDPFSKDVQSVPKEQEDAEEELIKGIIAGLKHG